MDVTFVFEDKVVTLQLVPTTFLHSLPPILQADFSISPSFSLLLHHNNRQLDPALTLESAGIRHQDVIEVTKALTASHDIRSIPPALWMNPPALHQHFRQFPQLLDQVRHDRELTEALNAPGPERLTALMQHRMSARMDAARAEQARVAAISADPMSAEAQRLIEEEIRQKNIAENMENAIEYSPESFGHIIMLYVPMIVNGHPLQAFVDSGAQSTIMTRSCAERCGIMRLCDTRFAGIAKGVGTAKILGRVHSVKVQVGSVFFMTSFTILDTEGGTDFLFGLDQLRKHRSCIDLEKNCLRILGQEIQFLAEKDLPASARGQEQKEEGGQGGKRSIPAPLPPQQPRPTPVASLQPSTLPAGPAGYGVGGVGQAGYGGGVGQVGYGSGAGQMGYGGGAAQRPPINIPAVPISAAPAPAAIPMAAAAGGGQSASEAKVQTLMELGFQRSEVERALQLNGGNEERAASFLFNQQFGQ